MYSALPYAIAQVNLHLQYHRRTYSLFNNKMFFFTIYGCDAGCGRNPICVHPGHVLHCDSVLHDEFPMDSSQVSLVLLHIILLLLILHLLRNDDCFYLTKPSSCRNLRSDILFRVQPLLWFLHPKTCKFLFSSNTCIRTVTLTDTVVCLVLRKFQSGGYGTIGYAHWLGQCMGL